MNQPVIQKNQDPKHLAKVYDFQAQGEPPQAILQALLIPPGASNLILVMLHAALLSSHLDLERNRVTVHMQKLIQTIANRIDIQRNKEVGNALQTEMAFGLLHGLSESLKHTYVENEEGEIVIKGGTIEKQIFKQLEGQGYLKGKELWKGRFFEKVRTMARTGIVEMELLPFFLVYAAPYAKITFEEGLVSIAENFDFIKGVIKSISSSEDASFEIRIGANPKGADGFDLMLCVKNSE